MTGFNKMIEVRSSAQPGDRVFFSLTGLWFVTLAFVAFSQSFYLRVLPEPLPAHQIVHGVVYSAWVVLFLAQALLISTHRMRWHFALGAASVFLLILMIPAGFYVVLVKTSTGLKSPDEAGFNITALTLGFMFALSGLAYRKRSFVHKRLMLFATLMLTVAAADRVALVLGLDEVWLFRKFLAVTPGIALVVYDTLSRRGGPFLSLSLLAMVWLVIWLLISDLVFLHSSGEAIIRALTKAIVW